MIVAVAIVGTAFGAEVMRRRRAYFLRRLDGCRHMYVVCKRVEDGERELVPILERAIKEAQDYVEKNPGDEQGKENIQSVEFYKKHIEKVLKRATSQSNETTFWLNLTRKYEHAARYPWLAVEPDPPQPE
jgi:hypothetical protein